MTVGQNAEFSADDAPNRSRRVFRYSSPSELLREDRFGIFSAPKTPMSISILSRFSLRSRITYARARRKGRDETRATPVLSHSGTPVWLRTTPRQFAGKPKQLASLLGWDVCLNATLNVLDAVDGWGKDQWGRTGDVVKFIVLDIFGQLHHAP